MSNTVERAKLSRKHFAIAAIIYAVAALTWAVMAATPWSWVHAVVAVFFTIMAVKEIVAWRRINALLHDPLIYLVALQDEFGHLNQGGES